ncbi:MAG TPA: ABC transporter permease [Terriglobales bacterium]|nr:ABC transporter permease [Terriglobales bacterium]
METFLQDLKYAARMLAKRPAFTAVAVLSLTLGIGANTTIFTLAKAVFLQTVPAKEPTKLMVVFGNSDSRRGPAQEFLPISYLNSRDLRDKNDVFAGASIVSFTGLNLKQNGKDTGLFCEVVDSNFFDLMGVAPMLGRAFTADENTSPHPVAILSNAVWKREFAQDPGVVGRSLQLGTDEYTIVGVMPADFHDLGVFGSPDAWIPWSMHETALTGVIKDWYGQRGARFTFVVGRLKPGVTVQQAQSSMVNLAAELQREYPTDNGGRSVQLLSLADTTIPPQQRQVFVLAGVMMAAIVGLVLLIACANVANLLLARATQRQREIAIRQSMGASRNRLVRQLLTESLLLGLMAGGLGILCAYWARKLILGLIPQGALPQGLDFSLDWTVIGFTFGLAILSTALFGLMPAVQTSRTDRLAALRDRTDAPTGSTRWYGLRGALVMLQVALSLIALMGAGLFIHSLKNAQQIDPGFDVQHEFIVRLNLGPENYPQAKAEQFFDDVVNRVKQMPMVADAGIADAGPFQGPIARTTFLEGADRSDPRNGHTTPVMGVKPGFFSASGMTLIRGRDFDDHDDSNSTMVAIVNQAFVDKNWPGQDPIGKHLYMLLTTWDLHVVGVVNTVKTQTLGEPPQPVIYYPLKQHYVPNTVLWVRAKGDPTIALPNVRTAVQEMDKGLPLRGIRTVGSIMGDTLAPARVGAELLGTFGFLALALAAIGTYGVMSYSVNQRTQEIGIRMALGAQKTDVLRLILGGGMAMVAVGIAAGLAISTLLTRSMNALLFGIGLFDPASFFGTALILIGVALVACWLPARRASRVDPMIALRYE